MPTSYKSYKAFMKTASGSEKDAYNLFCSMDDMTGSEVLEREDDLRAGAHIHAAINKGHAGMTEDELLAEALEDIDDAVTCAEMVGDEACD